MASLSKITFTVEAKVLPGECVMVSGDAVSLGGFATSNAIPLVTTPETYPKWRTMVPVTVPLGFPVKYMCVSLSEKTSVVCVGCAEELHSLSLSPVSTAFS
jgi:hypothetical protein